MTVEKKAYLRPSLKAFEIKREFLLLVGSEGEDRKAPSGYDGEMG